MKNTTLGQKILLVSLAVLVLVTLFQKYIIPSFIGDDISNLTLFTGAIATLYTLIVAFIIVEVWGQFNSISKYISEEAKAITSIWNYTDYLNDSSLSKKMKEGLLSYINVASNSEKKDASQGIRSVHPSKELVGILKIIDKVTFDDNRDSAIFPNLITSFENLSSLRSERIDASTNRLPGFLKILFQSLSVIVVVFFMFQPFNDLFIALFGNLTLAILVSISYFLVEDMDNPFEGHWNVDYSPLQEAKDYIGK